MQIQPKPYMDKMRLRNHAKGIERRRNMSKLILEKGTPLPKPIEYSDIDEAMYKWVDEVIDLSYDGKRLPTYKLYSTQRISEYIQEWSNTDEVGNPNINFKIVTRENNPQKGESQGNYYNIPGHKDFAMFYVPVLQENGTEAFDKYTMKQPFAVNFLYSVSIISNKMEVINKMNEMMHYQFSAINAFISPNEHPMSMTLEDISDNSEYSIDDRKYYSQVYKIKVKGYIIRKEDFKVERIPSRMLMPWRDSDASGAVNRRGKNRREDEKVKFINFSDEQLQEFNIEAFENDDRCDAPATENNSGKPSDIYEETSGNDDCCEKEENRYYNKVMKVIMTFDCISEIEFEIDKEMVLDTVETSNVYDFKLLVNGEVMNLDEEIRFIQGDKIMVRITREDLHGVSEVTLVGYDPNVVFDSLAANETVLDEPFDEEDIIVGKE